MKPHYNLCVKMKQSNEMGRVGVAWKGKDGAINIKLNPGAYLDYALSQNAFINLFPVDQPKPNPYSSVPSGPPMDMPDITDKDVPF